MKLLSVKLVEHIPGKLRVYKNGLGFSTSIYRWENTKVIPKLKFTAVNANPFIRVPTGTSYVQVIRNFGKAFLDSFNHGVHAPKI